jgi:hypothetical protein
LFFTTFTRVAGHQSWSPSLMLAMRRMSMRTGRVELERAAARGGFRVAEHDADLLAQLVDEDERGLRLRHDAGELAQRLRHEARLQPHLRFAHLALDFGLGTRAATESTTHHVHAVGAHQHSTISSACSPLSGCDTSRLSSSTPSFCAYCRVEAHARRRRTPPSRRASAPSAMTCSASVVLPDDSGPKISTTRPRGTPPMPSA